MAKPRPERKPKKARPAQPDLPAMPAREPPGTIRVYPMELRVGDKLSDESGEWEVIAHPYTATGGKSTNARVQRVDQPGAMETRSWGSYEKVTVTRRASR